MSRPKQKQRKCKECKVWRELIVMLIKAMPQPQKSRICAKLAAIPELGKRLSPSDRLQAKLIRAAYGDGE